MSPNPVVRMGLKIVRQPARQKVLGEECLRGPKGAVDEAARGAICLCHLAARAGKSHRRERSCGACAHRGAPLPRDHRRSDRGRLPRPSRHRCRGRADGRDMRRGGDREDRAVPGAARCEIPVAEHWWVTLQPRVTIADTLLLFYNEQTALGPVGDPLRIVRLVLGVNLPYRPASSSPIITTVHVGRCPAPAHSCSRHRMAQCGQLGRHGWRLGREVLEPSDVPGEWTPTKPVSSGRAGAVEEIAADLASSWPE